MSDDEIAELGKRARKCIENREFTDAEYYFKQITKLDDNNWYAWYGRGLCFKRLRMYERGIFCFSKATTIDPKSPKGWYNLGFCQSQIGEIEDALFHLNKAIKLEGSYPIAKMIKAWIYYQHNNKSAAIKLIENVLDGTPEFIENLRGKIPEEEPEDYQIAIQLLEI